MKRRSIMLGVGTLIIAGGIAFSTGIESQAESQDAAATVVEEKNGFNFRMPMHNLSEEDYQNMRKHHSEVHNGKINAGNGLGSHCNFEK